MACSKCEVGVNSKLGQCAHLSVMLYGISCVKMTSKLTFNFFELLFCGVLHFDHEKPLQDIDKNLYRRSNSAELDKWTGQELKRLLSDIFGALSSEPVFEKVEFKSSKFA